MGELAIGVEEEAELRGGLVTDGGALEYNVIAGDEFTPELLCIELKGLVERLLGVS